MDVSERTSYYRNSRLDHPLFLKKEIKYHKRVLSSNRNILFVPKEGQSMTALAGEIHVKGSM